MGAKITGAGTSRIVIEGVAKLDGARHRVLPDRIETGTYAMAVAMTGGDVLLEGARAELLQSALDVLAQAGVEVTATNTGIRVARNGAGLGAVEVTTAPFPGFPTDLQAQLMALMTRAKGTSRITETIFENRFMHVQELARLGAHIQLDGETRDHRRGRRLNGAPVMATDLRASVSLVIAALAAEGETMVNRVYHLDRGFERLEDKLSACGAAIERISGYQVVGCLKRSHFPQNAQGMRPPRWVAPGDPGARAGACRHRRRAAGGVPRRPEADPGGGLMFGRKIGDRIAVSESQWARFVDREITPRFPDGLTVFDASGQWRDRASNKIVREREQARADRAAGQCRGRWRGSNEIVEAYKSPVPAAIGRPDRAAGLRVVLVPPNTGAEGCFPACAAGGSFLTTSINDQNATGRQGAASWIR